ncbi:MAG: excinuclease ABC subunit UvrC, partial [Chloroflexi bacterium]|nr:excinuclease ABC subunit UvrC [Chloroflexota bacterium]
MPESDSIRSKLSQLPHKPGVYLMKDRFGTVIYVGKARDLRKRVSQYFHPSRRLGWDLKFQALIEAIHDFDVHVVRSEPEAFLLEGKLIKEFHPRYNVSFRDDKRFLLVKVNLNDPIPRFTFTRFKQDDGARYFGPFANSGALRRTLDLVRHKFNLRGCRPLTPTENDYKHCLYAHLKVCTAPCLGNVTREEYLQQVLAACEFLDGECEEMARQVQEEMRKAAGALDFEKAAQLRDLLSDLRQTTRKMEKFERLPYSLPVAIDPQRDLAELGRLLQLPGPPQRIEGFDISNISGTFAVASMVSFRQGRPDRSNYRRFKMKTVTGQDDFACMAETVRRRYTRLLNEAKVRSQKSEGRNPKGENGKQEAESRSPKSEARSPKPEVGTQEAIGAAGAGQSSHSGPQGINSEFFPNLILIDGGKGQLNAACAELAKLGLSHIPVIGLAKEFEEIFQPGASEPLRLSHHSGALKLLQRVRDESHRFANTYNAQLRLK